MASHHYGNGPNVRAAPQRFSNRAYRSNWRSDFERSSVEASTTSGHRFATEGTRRPGADFVTEIDNDPGGSAAFSTKGGQMGGQACRASVNDVFEATSTFLA